MYFSKGSICNLIFEQSKDVIIKVETLRPARSTSNNATSFPFLSFTYATIYFLGVMPSSKNANERSPMSVNSPTYASTLSTK